MFTVRYHHFFSRCRKQGIKLESQIRDKMETKTNRTQVEAAVLAQHTSTASRPSRESRHANNNQEVQRYYDQLWHSKERRSPSLLFYRKLSCESEEGTILNEEYDCLDCNSKLLSNSETLDPEFLTSSSIEGIANTITQIPGKSSEGSPCQLDSSREGLDGGRNRTGSTHCSCTMSNLYTRPNIYCCHSPASSLSPSTSPVHSPHLSSNPRQFKHIRRGSLPVSMLAFNKVVKEKLVWIYMPLQQM